jgi:hypothetical protein
MSTTTAPPWEGYDEATAKQIADHLDANPEVAHLILAYETAHKKRVTVTEAAEAHIAKAQTTEPTYEVARVLHDRRILAEYRPEVLAGAFADAGLADEDLITIPEVNSLVDAFLDRPAESEEDTGEQADDDTDDDSKE